MRLKFSKILIGGLVVLGTVTGQFRAYAFLGFGDVVHDPLAYATQLKEWVDGQAELAQLIQQVHQAIELVKLATRAKEIMGDPEGALMAAGWALGIDDDIAEILESPAGVEIREAWYDINSLTDSINELDRAWKRFEGVEAGARDMNLYQKYVKLNDMAERFLYINRTHPSLGVLGEKNENRLYEAIQSKLDRLNGYNTDQSRQQLMAEMDALINQSTTLYHQRFRGYSDVMVQKIMQDNEDEMIDETKVEDIQNGSQGARDYSREERDGFLDDYNQWLVERRQRELDSTSDYEWKAKL